jgi:hypothetical protein
VCGAARPREANSATGHFVFELTPLALSSTLYCGAHSPYKKTGRRTQAIALALQDADCHVQQLKAGFELVSSRDAPIWSFLGSG